MSSVSGLVQIIKAEFDLPLVSNGFKAECGPNCVFNVKQI